MWVMDDSLEVVQKMSMWHQHLQANKQETLNQKLIGPNAQILHSATVHFQNTSMLDLENITFEFCDLTVNI